MRLNRPFALLTAGMVALFSTSETLAHRAGAPALRNGSTASSGLTCAACHGNSLGHLSGNVTILNAPTTYNLNRLYDVTVRVRDTVQVGAGFEFSAESPAGAFRGTLILSDTVNTRFTTGNTNFVTHTSTGVNNSVANWAALGNLALYDFQWRAPATNQGQVTFWAAGNAINNNLNNGGDRVYLTNFNTLPAICDKADVTNDTFKDGLDVAHFVAVFLNPDAATPQEYCASDMNDDGVIDILDVPLFVDALLN